MHLVLPQKKIAAVPAQDVDLKYLPHDIDFLDKKKKEFVKLVQCAELGQLERFDIPTDMQLAKWESACQRNSLFGGCLLVIFVGGWSQSVGSLFVCLFVRLFLCVFV